MNKEEINGWGMDSNPKDNPAYPMRHDIPADHINKGLAWIRPTKQKTDQEILHSNERPSLSAVFSDTEPPKGLSGVLRRGSFKYSESDLRHWMGLMLADRIDMIESVFEDLFHGKFPNLYKEMGWKMEMKYNTRLSPIYL